MNRPPEPTPLHPTTLSILNSTQNLLRIATEALQTAATMLDLLNLPHDAERCRTVISHIAYVRNSLNELTETNR